MSERPNPNPDSAEFRHMLGDPNVTEDQLFGLAHVFRCYVEGTAREYSKSLVSSEEKKSTQKIMIASTLVPLSRGVSIGLIRKARRLGIQAGPVYAGVKE